MKKMRRVVTAAEGDGNSKLQDMMDMLKDDFDYVLAGLEKLDRTGATESNQGLVIAEGLSDALQSAISQISENM